MICLDTTFLVDVLRGKPGIRETVDQFDQLEAPLAISSVSFMELWEGVHRFDLSQQERKKIEQLVSSYIFLPFQKREARQAAMISAELMEKGTPIGTEDVMIAATAVAQDAYLYTDNEKHFQYVENLELWTF